MCPSYLGTNEEKHSTRGRARLLFEMVRGDALTDGFANAAVEEALDLCLACKGCKHDCPVETDMATYKAEFRARHYENKWRPRAAYSMGRLPGGRVTHPMRRASPISRCARLVCLASPSASAASPNSAECRGSPARPTEAGIAGMRHGTAASE